jgi:hypothetical protein
MAPAAGTTTSPSSSLTQKLHQPYRIVLRNGDKTVYSLQLMDSKLVATRFPDLAAIYD